MWLTTLMLAEAWHVDPEHVSTMKRGMYWAQRWNVYQDVKSRIQSGHRSAPSAEANVEPEWMVLERRMKSGGA